KTGSDVGMIDNVFGLLFGAFRGALIVSLGFYLISIFMHDEREYPDWLKQSATRPYVEKGAIMLVRIAPDYLREISSLQQKLEDKIQNEKASPYTNVGNDQQMDQMIHETGQNQ